MKTTKLAQKRIELRLSQKDVATKAGVPYSTYQKLDNGTRDFKTTIVGTAMRIAKVLQTTVEDLCEE